MLSNKVRIFKFFLFVLSIGLLIRLVSSYAAARRPVPIEVAVTVDDLPGMGALPMGRSRIEIARDMIAALKKYGVPAYGFANGVQLDSDPVQVGVLKHWANAGFPVGNHTFSHLNLAQVNAQVYIADIARMDRRLATLDLSDDFPGLRRTFRYPYLAEGDTLIKRDAVRTYLFLNQYRIAEVTVDFHDWAWNDAFTRCLGRKDQAGLEHVKNRSLDSAMRHLNESQQLARMLFGRDIRHILLLHMGAFEAADLASVLAHYHAAGVKFVSLRRAMEDPLYTLNPNYAYAGRDMTFLVQTVTSRRLRNPYLDTTDTLKDIAEICR
jgi:peptidoglycan/xylan/chitin deacetylase (PgdA/CDA1 family)